MITALRADERPKKARVIKFVTGLTTTVDRLFQEVCRELYVNITGRWQDVITALRADKGPQK